MDCHLLMVQRTVLGILIVFFLAVSWVGSQQFAQSAVLSENFTAPYFATWYSTCWMTLCFPVYCLFSLLFLTRDEFIHSFQISRQIFGSQKVCIADMFTKILPFNVLWVFVNYIYVFSLTYIAATDASAILSTNIAFVYVFSFIFLSELVYAIRIIASIFCITGVVLFGYADGFDSGSNLVPGVLMALFAALGAAIYKAYFTTWCNLVIFMTPISLAAPMCLGIGMKQKELYLSSRSTRNVVFKRVIGEGRLGQVSLFLTLLGITNFALVWIFFLPLYFTGVEKITFSDIPWMYISVSAALALVFNFLVNFGVAFTYPLFISIAMVMGIPLNAAVDVLIRGDQFSFLRLVAALLLVAGFCLMILPDKWNLPLHRCVGASCSRCYLGNIDEDQDALIDSPLDSES